MDTLIKQEVVEKEPREVILSWKERPKEKSKYESWTDEKMNQRIPDVQSKF